MPAQMRQPVTFISDTADVPPQALLDVLQDRASDNSNLEVCQPLADRNIASGTAHHQPANTLLHARSRSAPGPLPRRQVAWFSCSCRMVSTHDSPWPRAQGLYPNPSISPTPPFGVIACCSIRGPRHLHATSGCTASSPILWLGNYRQPSSARATRTIHISKRRLSTGRHVPCPTRLVQTRSNLVHTRINI